MKKHLKIFTLALFIITAANAKADEPAWAKTVGAKKFPAKTREFVVTDFGAVADGKTLNTKSIQLAIDKCAGAGGGIVHVKAGKYLTGSLFIKSNVNFMLDEGAELMGSQNITDYPDIDTRVAGIEMKWTAALLNISSQSNAAITGKGLVNAQGKPFWDMYWNLRKEYEAKGLRWIVDYDAKRPRTLLVTNSTDVTIKGITLQQAGFWTVQLLYSNQVTVDGITIRNNVDGHGPSTDGVDVDSSTRILIQNCDIDCNDDNFCLKSGRDWDGLRVNKPTEYVVIRDCLARAGAGLLTLGSETSGGIRHVLATNLKGNGTSNGLNLKSATTRGGTLEDIHFQNITMNGVGTAFQITLNWNPAYSYSKLPDGYTESTLPPHWKKLLAKVEPASKGIPHFKDVYISNVNATGAKKAINAIGLPESQLQNFQFTNVNIQAKTAGDVKFSQGWKWTNSTITATDGTKLTIPE
ncbi:glycoside hydrolase family 28 protein [Mucilaginibacter terrae]|uniref:Polygalacturonase n=1 Tax=Mucilaginibacter terrae TaxID=1955052 RepID=A0ABU3GWE7_9SPHI|nr:glycoside hydrolase family 28 protein [Mucilaginibacter terrae]MDT3404087.1 polygalacturonase [Mucilaginibacter terrae]